jgi:large subunit ribosomal protein L22
VSKGHRGRKYPDFKGRGRVGIKLRPDSRISVVLKEGKTREEIMKAERERKLRKVVSPGIMREDIPLRKVPYMWAW